MEGGPPLQRCRSKALAVFAALAAIALIVALHPTAAAFGVRRPRQPPRAHGFGQPAPAPMSNATGVSCGNLNHCVVVGLGPESTAVVANTTDGGRRWSDRSVPTSIRALAGISCSTPKRCLAVGSTDAAGAVISTINGGKNWTVTGTPSGAAVLTAVQCAGLERCVALVTDGMSYWSAVTLDHGASWTRGGPLPSGMKAIGLSCPSTLRCLAVGFSPTGPGHGSGAIALTSDGGTTWTPATLPAGSGILHTVTCAGEKCLAAGSTSTATTGFVPGAGELFASTDGGATWALVKGAVSQDDAFATECPSARVCIVVGARWLGTTPPDPTGSVVVTIDGGQHWRRAVLHYVAVSMAALSCPVINRCVAVGGNEIVRLRLPVKAQPSRGTHRGR